MTPTHIPLDHPQVAMLRALIPAEWHQYAWIAGSAAARWPEAYDRGGDIDCWLLAESWPAYSPICAYFWAKYGQTPVQDDYEHVSDRLYSKDRIQIHGASYMSHTELVGQFDISCHAAAVHLITGETYAHPEFSPLVRIITINGPRINLERGMRFARRYQDRSFWDHGSTKHVAAQVFRYPELAVDAGL